MVFLPARSFAELITALPGQSSNVSFRQYSGYIVTDTQHGRALFYYFVEADSPNPLLHPLTLWLNGESNMLYVETPVGVGFSYSNTSSDYINWNDTQTAQENLQFIVNWFQEFPKYRDLDLYLTGESYAGHYIPQLGALLLDYNKQPNVKPINLRAIALGNRLLGIDISINDAEYYWSHGVISDEMLMLKKTVCNDTRYPIENINHNLSKECIDVFKKLDEEVGDYTDSGDLLLPICLSQSVAGQSVSEGVHDALHSKVSRNFLTSRTTIGDPCLRDRIFLYLNKPKVQEALHANTTHLVSPWDFCSGPLSYQKDNIAINIIPLIAAFLKAGLPVLLYSGDQDSKIPLTQTRIIANMLARDLKLISFRRYGPWYDKMQVGGWTQSFGRLRKGENVTYLMFTTVRGVAHEVRFTFPSQALTMFRAFLRGSALAGDRIIEESNPT
ncbi:hypothetical protein L1049_006011 [Liquidambar formosana]|uniref:Carboxypeptidase n=1 Tax=Liquidambar formosana TaxID=63359 RepID=A0AAP0RET2_LIQFO